MIRASVFGLSLSMTLVIGCATAEPTTHTRRIHASAALQRGEPVDEPLRFVPSDTTSILRVDLARARDVSPHYADFTRWLRLLQPFGRGGEEALIDLLGRTRRLYVTLDRYRGHSEPRCLILEGDYQRGEVETTARKVLNQVVVANSFRVEGSPRPAMVYGANTLVQLDDDYTWLFCANRVLDDALDGQEPPDIFDPQALSSRGVPALDSLHGMVAMVGLGAPGTREFPLEYRRTIDSHAGSIRGFSFRLELDEDGLLLRGHVFTGDSATVAAMEALLPALLHDALRATPLGLALAEESEAHEIRTRRDPATGLIFDYRLDAPTMSRLMARLNALVLLSQEATGSD